MSSQISQLTVAKATATSDDGNVPANAIDSNDATRWSAQGVGQKLFLDLGNDYQISKVEIKWYKSTSRSARGSILVDNVVVYPSFSSDTKQAIMSISFAPAKGKLVTIVCNGNNTNDWNSIVEAKVFGAIINTPLPEPEPTPPPATGLDYWGIKMIHPTKAGGRVWNAPFDKGAKRTLSSGQRDGTDDLKPLGSAKYTIDPATKEMTINGGVPRVYVFDEARSKLFENVEITCYYNSISGNLASYQGFEIGTRGQHELGGTNARTYYARHSLSGKYDRMKEEVHPNTLATTTVKTGVTFSRSKYYGMKLIVRTLSDGSGVNIKSYQDLSDGANGGTWNLMFDYTDKSTGSWGGYPIYKPSTANCKCVSTFARTDNATDFRIKKFSIREVGPL